MWSGNGNLLQGLRQDLTRTETVLEEHIKSCGKSAEQLRLDLAQREQRSQEWRAGLGEDIAQITRRFDSQDNQMRRIFIGVIGVLLAVVGFLIEHAGIFNAIKP